MNETTESIFGILVGVLIGAAVLIPAMITIRAEVRKFRQAWDRARLEHQPEGSAVQMTVTHEPESPRLGVLVVMSLLVVIWGVMTGFGVGAFSQLLYITFVIPLAMGISSGKMIVEVIKRAKIRSASQVVFLCVLSAVVIYSSFHYTRYLGFLVQMSAEISEEFSGVTDEDEMPAATAVADYALQEETGHSGFVGYMLYRAQEGVSIGRWYRSSRINLGPVLTWLYWLLELGIIYGVAVFMGKNRLRTACCASCGNPVGGEKHLGGTAAANESTLLHLIRQKDFAEMGKLMQQDAGVPSLEVYYRGCTVCGKGPSQLVVRHAFQTAQGGFQITDASRMALQPGESALLLSQFSFSGD